MLVQPVQWGLADMSILTEIVRHREQQLRRLVTPTSIAAMREAARHAPAPRDFLGSLRGNTVQVIAEIKRASPSRGTINASLDPAALAAEYHCHGAAAISVLTEEDYFAGHIDDLRLVREAAYLPILRKDFVISPYQIYEARAAGADALLLIAGVLQGAELATMLKLTHDLGMTALVEVHTEQELQSALAAGAALVGINNRNLNTLKVSLDTTVNLAHRVPAKCVLVSESGIRSRADVERVAGAGADAVLVGTSLVAAKSSGHAVHGLLGVPTSRRNSAAGKPAVQK